MSSIDDEGPAADVRAAPSSFRAFTAEDWARIEDVSPATRAVGQMMRHESELLFTGAQHASTVYCSKFDEDLYKHLCNFAEVPCSSAATPSNPKGKVTMQSRRHATSASVKKHLREAAERKVMASVQQCPRFLTQGLQWEVFVVHFRRWVRVRRKGSALLDAYVSLDKFRHFAARVELPSAVLDDLGDDWARLTKGADFAATLDLVLDDAYPLIKSSFVGAQELELYAEQRQVAEALSRTLQQRQQVLALGEGAGPAAAVCIRFCTPPSTGKSSAAAYVGSLMSLWQKSASDSLRQKLKPSFVVYVCYSESVRFDVAATCVAASIPFAILTHDIVSPSFSCYHGKAKKSKVPVPPSWPDRVLWSLKVMEQCDLCPAVLVADPQSAFHFLHERQQHKTALLGDILLFDEPTAAFDSELTRLYALLWRVAPPLSVLMSATLPAFDDMPNVLNVFRDLYPSLELVDVSSERIMSPCTVRDASGAVFAPHRLFNGSLSALQMLLDENLHLQRLYSPGATAQLLQDFPQHGLELHIRDALSFARLRQVAWDVMKAQLARDPATKCVRSAYALPDLTQACTVKASSYLGISMVLCGTEHEFRTEALAPLLVNSERLHRRLHRWLKQSACPVFRAHDGADRGTGALSQLERSRLEAQEAEKCDAPELWPSELCVNTAAHALRFRAQLPSHALKQVPRLPTDVLETSNVDLVEAALAGVACLNARRGDRSLALASLQLAERQQFSFLSSGLEGIFGVNLPTTRVLILQNLTDPSTLIQALGRTGRTGKFRDSEVVFGHMGLLNLLFQPKELATQAALERALESR